MLDELKFVQGGVGKTDVAAAMTHFCIENGEIAPPMAVSPWDHPLPAT
ncbi:hypothetical protein [Stenotrophomonas phage CM2]